MKNNRKSTRSTAILAVLFASSLLNEAARAVSAEQSETESAEQSIRRIVSSRLSPEGRAIWLLVFADRVLKYENLSNMRDFFRKEEREPDWMLRPSEKNERASLVLWASQTNRYGRGAGYDSRPLYNPPAARLSLANKSLQEAVNLLGISSNKLVKLNAYFVASRLFSRVGNVDGAKESMSAVDKLIKDCEENLAPDEERFKAAASLLTEQSFIALPAEPLELDQPRNFDIPPFGKPFADKQFQTAEKLRLRAVNLLDRLDSKNHFRRRAHRDLVLWYKFLGKDELASKEKDVLFDLVGVRDDSILYPKYRGCGRLVWWNSETETEGGMLCGLG